MWAALQVVAGLVVLTVGADFLVRGAARLAALLRVSPLVVSLTIVAYGTGAPELAVSGMASVAGEGDLALGNIVGSNIFNVLAVLGASALVGPLIISRQILVLDLPVMLGASLVLYLFGRDGELSRLECVALLVCFAMYATVHLRLARTESRQALLAEARDGSAVRSPEKQLYLRQFGIMVAGLALLVAGSEWLVSGAVALANRFEVGHALIGLLIVAPGTGLPELATSIMASVRGERDIAVGNIVGSNTFNILAVLGVAGLASRSALEVNPDLLSFDIPVMVGIAAACYPVFLNDLRLRRLEGVGLLLCYFAYVTLLVLTATDHPALAAFRSMIFLVLAPIVGVLLAAAGVRAVRRHVLRSRPPGR